ncbi:MAG TPA: DUF1161 domain-containing protein [Fibrobacteria bacterium]|nr:DUF1161 domain-containing protein [Fibrobacteria bacterium]
MKTSTKTLITLIALAAASSFSQPADKVADKMAPVAAAAKTEKAAPEAKVAKTEKVAPEATAAKSEKVASGSIGGAKSCDELKAAVSEKIESKGVKNFTLEIVANDEVKGGKIVGSCGGGTKKLVYTRG